MIKLPREQWGAALGSVAQEELKLIIDGLPPAWQLKPKSLPQAGLAMLKIRESNLQESFYLGEFPLTSISIVLVDDSGQEYEGAAMLMDDDLTLTESIAVCDCILANRLYGWEKVVDIIKRGQKVIEEKEATRNLILQRTRVDFSLLEEVDDNDA